MKKNQKLLLLVAVGAGIYAYQKSQEENTDEIDCQNIELIYDISELGALEQKYYIKYVCAGINEDELWEIISEGNVLLSPDNNGDIRYTATENSPYIDVTRG